MMATMSSPWDSVDGAKYEAAMTRKGRGGLGFSRDDASTASAGPSTEASRALMNSAGAFSAQSYLEKFGWKTGSGLGAKGTGIESYVKPTKKFDNAGIGAALTGALITNAAFETLFNATARSVNIVVFSSSDESSDDSDAEARQARKKRKRSDDKPSQSPPPAVVAAPSPPPSRPCTLHPSMRLQFRPSTEGLLSEESIVAVVEEKQVSLLHTFDPSRSHMYHDRSIGKLARLKAMDAKIAASSSPSPASPPAVVVAQEDSDESSTNTESIDNEDDEKLNKSERKRLRKERKEAKRAAKAETIVDDSEAQSKKKKKKKKKSEDKSNSSSEN